MGAVSWAWLFDSQAAGAKRAVIGLCLTLGACLAVLGVLSAPAQATEAPIAAYSFDENEGETLHDDAGEHDGTLQGGAEWTAGKFGSALHFDAEDDCVVIPDSNDLDLGETFTLEAWLRPQQERVWGPAISKDASGEWFSYELFAHGETGTPMGLVAESGPNYAEAVGEDPLPSLVWSHLALTSDGEDLRLYLNGEVIDTVEALPPRATEKPLRLGCSETWGSFEGLIDEVRIYDRALGIEEIGEDLETAIATPPSQDPIAAYSFDEGEGETANDAFGSHDGTVEDAEWVGGKFGGALRFDNEEEQKVRIAGTDDLQLSGSFTLEAWVRPQHAAYWLSVITKEAGTQFGYQLYAGGEGPGHAEGYVALKDWTFAETSGTEAMTPRTWTHLALSCDGKQLRLYEDGELVDSGGPCSAQGGDGDLLIGGNDVFGERFDGVIDEVRIYNRALGAEEIAEDRDTAIETPPSEDPIAAYSFDEGEGETAHDAFGSHDGAIAGADWVGGKFGRALRFDNEAEDVVTIADAADLQLSGSFTLEAWVRPASSQYWLPVINKETEGFISYQLYAGGQQPGNAEGYVAQRDWEFSEALAAEAIPPRAWTHLALTCDGEQLRLYEDSELVDTGGACSAQSSSGDLLIGANDVFNERFDGLIDEVRIYNRVLGAEEIEADRDTAIETPPSEEPIAAYSFDEGEGETAHDTYGSHDGTIDGAEWVEGKYGQALSFDREAEDSVEIPGTADLDLSDAFTLEAWVKPTENEDGMPAIVKETPGYHGYALYAAGEAKLIPQGMVAERNGEASEVLAEEPLALNTWAHLALSSDGDDLRLYLDGELVDTVPASSAQSGEGPLRIGGHDAWGYYFDGLIDEVRVYNRALGAEEVEEDAQIGVGEGFPTHFLHDADGRLKAMIKPRGGAAIYEWDPAGNLLSTTRRSATQLSVIQLSPSRADVGETILVQGTGFSATPASNTVKFNGTAAVVADATTTTLTVEVPEGASSGSVTVATPEKSPVASPESFTLASSDGLNVSSLSSTVVAAGDEVTMSGSGFDSSIADNVVRVNGAVSVLESASPTSIKFKVPPARLGGPVSVATPNGSDAGPDLFIPPGGAAPSTVSATDRMSIGGSKTVTVGAAEKVGLVLFEGTTGQRVSVAISESTIEEGWITLLSPSGTSIGPETYFHKAPGGMLEPVTLPATGTYTLRIDPLSSYTGSLKLSAYLVEDVTGSITPSTEGDKESVSLPVPGQSATYSVAATAGQKVSLKTSNSTFNGFYYAEWLDPEGKVISSTWWSSTSSGFWNNAVKLPTTGTYKLRVNPEGKATGTVDLTVWDASDLNGGSLTPSTEGDSDTFSVDAPAQQTLVSFEGTTGQRVSVAISESTIEEGWITLLSPSGTSIGPETYFHKAPGGMLEPVTLPATGTYTLRIDPLSSYTGSLKLSAYLVEDVTGSITPSTEGDKESVSLPVPGQSATYSVAATAGQKVSLKTSNSTFNGFYYAEWLDPEGKVISSTWWSSTSSGFWNNAVKLPTTGTYKLRVNPEGKATGTVDLTVWDASDLNGGSLTPSTEGDSDTFSVDAPAQQTLVSFEGTTGQRVSVAISESTIEEGWITLLSPSGTSIGPETYFHKAPGGMLEPVTLPATGTYTLRIDPLSSYTGSLKLSAYLVEDVTGSITPSTEGDKESVSLPVPGQSATYSVAATAGQKVSLKTSNSTFNGFYYAEWLDPEGKVISSTWWSSTSSGFWNNAVKLPTTGTYKLRVNPEGKATGTVDLTVWDASDLNGGSLTPSTEGDSDTFSVDAPAQQTLVSFEGTTGQRVSVAISESTIEEGWITLLSPSGTSIGPETYFHKAPGGMLEPVTLPATGTYTLRIDPLSSYTGSLKLSAYLVEDVTGSITPSTEGDKESVSLPVPGQSATYSVAATAGQKVSLKTSNSTFNGFYYAEWLDPEGKVISSTWWSSTSSGFWNNAVKLPTTGTYKLRVNPEGKATGTVDLTVWDASDLNGGSLTPSTEGDSDTFSVDAPAQQTLVSFEGTASAVVTLKTAESSITEGWISVLDPSGSLLPGSETYFSKVTTAKAEVTLPATGTYAVRIDTVGDYTGNVKVTAYLGPHASWMRPEFGAYELASFVGPPESTELAYSDIPAVVPRASLDGTGVGGSSRAAAFVSNHPQRNVSPQRNMPRPEPQKSGPDPQKGDVAHTNQPDRQPSRPDPQLFLERQKEINDELEMSLPAAFSKWEPKQRSWLPPKNSNDRGWAIGKSFSPWLEVASLSSPANTTALSGQALEVSGLPLVGMRVEIRGTSVATETDDAGRFLLSGAPSGRQVLVLEGESVPGGVRYGSYEVGVDLRRNETTKLDYTVWLTPLDKAGDLHVDSTTKGEARLSTPHIPGLEVRIPAGTAIRDTVGKEVRDLNITAIPVDRPPFPLPPFVAVPVYFTVQPGSARLSKGVQFVYPNWGDLAPGQRVDFWNYDAADRGWYVYGRGTVTPDGEQIAPDPDTRVWEFTGAMSISAPTPPANAPIRNAGATSGDPVDLRSGLFVYQKADLVLPDTIPVSIERTYRPNDTNSYDFGYGTTSLYDLRLWSTDNYKQADLVLPDGAKIHYVRTSPGTGYEEALYETTSSPTMFSKSTITWNAGASCWDLALIGGEVFSFDQLSRAPLRGIRDRFGNQLVVKRSGDNITQVVSPNGRWADFTYDGENRITKISDNAGRVVKYSYTGGYLTKVEAPEGRTTEYEYDGSGRMKAVINARGNKYLQIAYDANGRVDQQTTGDGGIFDFDYDLDEGGKVEATTVTDPMGNQRKVEFDAEGFPVADTYAPESEVAQATSFERQAKTGLILSKTDPLGRVTEFEYDGSGNVTEVTRMAGTEEAQTSKYAYESGTNRIKEATDPLGHITKYLYGPKGQMLKRTDPLGHETIAEYNAGGQPILVTNPEGEETELNYNAGDLVGVVDSLGRATTRFVDGMGRAGEVVSPGGWRTLLGYNDADELTSVTRPSGAETTIEYDEDGNPISVTDPRGNETTAEYDLMDRIESETDPLKQTAEWSYNKAGQLEMAKDRRGEVSEFDYDELGRLATASFGVSGESAESSVEYEYDEVSRLADVDDSASGEYGLAYDNLDRLTELESPNGDVEYEYDAAGRREEMAVNGSGTVEYEYDNADRLTEIERGEQVVSLGYDKADRLESAILPDGIEQHYGYDEAGELTSIAYAEGESSMGEIDYAYDSDGLTAAVSGSYARLNLPGPLTSAKYNAANELIEREGEELEYDEEGNLLSDGSSEYSWDARGQLTAIASPSNAAFAYDPFGRRISKTLGATTTDLLHDGANVVQESVEGSPTASLLTGLQVDQLFSRTTEAGTDSYLTDRLGSVIALADGSGEVQTTYAYDPFGTSTQAGEPSDNPFQFTARENDGTGLQYNRARYYSPTDARFISPDPAGFEGSGTNLYWYANANPLDFTDPTGEFASPNSVGDWTSAGPSVVSTLSGLLESLGGFIAQASGEIGPWKPDFKDPKKSPGPGWIWRPKGDPVGTGKGSWWNPETKEQLRPDLESEDHDPHYDRKSRDEKKGDRIYPDGRVEKK